MAILGVAALSLSGAVGAYFYYLPAPEVRLEGTRLIEANDHSVPKIISTARPYKSFTSRGFDKIWSIETEKQILSSPTLSGDLLLYGSYGNSLEAVARHDGASVWSLDTKAPVFALTKGDSGIIYTGEGLHDTPAASLSAIHAAEGKILWQREFLGHLEETAAIDIPGNRIWTSAGPGGLWAVDIRDGNALWHQPLGHIDARALHWDDKLFVPADTDEKKHKTVFYALDATKGKILWSLPLPGQPWGSPEIDAAGKILLSTTGIGQIGVNKNTDRGWAQGISTKGELIWQVQLPNMTLQPSIYIPDSDIIIHTTKNGYLIALHGRDGSLAWQARVGSEFRAPATLISGFKIPMIAAVEYSGLLTIRDARTGDELARRVVGPHAGASPVAEDDIIYVPGARSITAFGGLNTLAE